MTIPARETTEPAFEFPLGFLEALSFAAERHGRQLRKGSGVPYITHPVLVAETLAYHYPQSPDLIIAGLLHDVVEDTDTSLELVEEEFGSNVARLVEAVTKPELELAPADTEQEAKVERWRAQRNAMLEALDDEEEDVLRLKAADSLLNLRAIRRDLEAPGVGPGVWRRFKVGREESLDYYRRVLEEVRRLGNEPIVQELQRELEAVRVSGADVA
jgi:(p)ppGpp synthase/HD superfamily hydrolase